MRERQIKDLFSTWIETFLDIQTTLVARKEKKNRTDAELEKFHKNVRILLMNGGILYHCYFYFDEAAKIHINIYITFHRMIFIKNQTIRLNIWDRMFFSNHNLINK